MKCIKGSSGNRVSSTERKTLEEEEVARKRDFSVAQKLNCLLELQLLLPPRGCTETIESLWQCFLIDLCVFESR